MLFSRYWTDDAEADYRLALAVTMQWLKTWATTGDLRARTTALACAEIARERFAVLEGKRFSDREYRRLIFLERQAELDTIVDEVRATIAECRATLEEWHRAAAFWH